MRILDKINIIGIAPNNNLKILMDIVSEQYSNINYISVVGDLMEGVNKLNTFDLNKVDVIISRGGTALLLKKLFEIPVIEINITVYDILRSIHLAQNDDNKKAIVGFNNITEKAITLRSLLDLDYNIITINNKDTAGQVLKALKEDGYDTIISDTITSTIALKLNMNSILIESNEESLQVAFDNAINIGQSQIKIKKENYILTKINKHNSNKTIVIDNNYNFLSKYSSNDVTKELSTKVINFFKNNNFEKTSFFQIIDENSVYNIQYNHELFSSASLYIFYVHKIDNYYPKKDIINEYSILFLSNELKKRKTNVFALLGEEFQKKMELYSKIQEPIFIWGEEGTPIQELVYRISVDSKKSDILWTIDVKEMERADWHNIINSQNSVLSNVGTLIFFQNMEYISEQNWNLLKEYSENTYLYNRNKIIYSAVINKKQHPPVLKEIINNFLSLRIPSIKEKISYLYSLITLFINEINSDYGKNVIGIEPNAMDIFVRYHWPENHSQLKHIIRQLVVQSEEAFITKAQVIDTLSNEKILYSMDAEKDFYRNKTLEEINYEIIKNAIEEANGNKTKAAERLGISRSSIWRVLNRHE